MFLTYQFLSEKNNILSNSCLIVIIISLFTILIKDIEIIERIGPNLIFIAIVIVLHSVFYHSFNQECSNGIIEQILLQPINIELFLAKRIFYTSLFYQVSTLMIMPILGILININSYMTCKLILATLFSIPTIIALSLLGGILSMKKGNNNIVMSIITLPLLIPISILGNSIIYNITEYKALLSLFLLVIFTFPINIIAISHSLKISIYYE